MRYPADHKEKTRARMLEAGARAFQRSGFSASGIDSVMEDAGMTAGAFYKHFPSKDAFFAAVIETSLQASARHHSEALGNLEGLERAHAFVTRYLSMEHWARPESGCPLPVLTAEAARNLPRVREAVASGVGKLTDAVFQSLPRALDDREALASQVVAGVVGAMTLARTMEADAADDFLAANRQELLKRLSPTPTDPHSTV